MKIPKIKFHYSWIYDAQYRNWNEQSPNPIFPYPSSEEILFYIKKVSAKWNRQQKKILEELSRVSKLKWKVDEIPCYVVGSAIPFSDPLTLPVYKHAENYFIDMLTHELIHQLFTQKGNIKRAEKSWKYFDKKFSNESENTRKHIPLHALHAHIYITFFGEERMKNDIAWAQSLPDYKRSWELVQHIGYNRLVQEWRKRL